MPTTPEFNIAKMTEEAYRPLFAQNDVPLWVATVTVAGHTFTFSHRLDDPEGVWYADSLIGPGGMPHFVHGDGERSCAKSRPAQEVEDALNARMANGPVVKK